MFEKNFELPMSKEYVRHWGMAEAIREIIQNALDSDSPFEWEIESTNGGLFTLVIRSKFARLEPSSLLLGTTSKAEDVDTIGSFGEGYKIALLVLTRLEYGVIIHNRDSIWTPEFRYSKKFESETLWVISKNNDTKAEGVSFYISGLSEQDIEEVKDSCLYMQKDIGAVKTTSKGLILMDNPGKLFVGGLYICDTGLDYGYDIKPEFIKLERDRQTVDGWDLKYLIKDMWFEIDNKDFIAELMEKDCPDLSHAEYGAPEIVKEACYKLFKKKHGENALIATSQKEMEEMVEKGMTTTVFVGGGGYSSAVRSSSSYSTRRTETVRALSVTAELTDWLKANKKHMRRHAIVNFQELITKSTHWSKK